MSKIKDPEERAYYLKLTANYGWTRNVLGLQIDGNSYKHHVVEKKQHNFEKTLAPALAEQADKAMKSVYSLEMLGIQKQVFEREIEFF